MQRGDSDMKNRIKKYGTLLFCGMFLLGMMIQPMQVSASEPEWNYVYNGTEQEFIAPYFGTYRFELAGAQGGDSDYKGGKGGQISVLLTLRRGEKISLFIGGKNGYNGGGTGTASCGGGATDIRMNGERIAIAGGGGGGTKQAEGGDGGNGGNNGTMYYGSHAPETQGSAGGGGGYMGGTAGYYYTVTKAHSHESSCYEICEGTVHYEDANGDGFCCGSCDRCGKEFTNSDQLPGCHPEPHSCQNRTLLCTMSEQPVTIPYEAQSFGGSNWYESSVCKIDKEEIGIQEGDGKCTIKLISMYRLYFDNIECHNIYYGEIKVKKIYFNDCLIYME